MRYLILTLTLLMLSFSSFGQGTFCDGWDKGYQAALKSCREYATTPTCPSKFNNQSYSDGYGKGYAEALLKCPEKDKTKTLAERTESNSGTDQFGYNSSIPSVEVDFNKIYKKNPINDPKNWTSTSATTLTWDDVNKEMEKNYDNYANNLRRAAANGAFLTASQKAKDIVPIKSSLNSYKYLVIKDIKVEKDSQLKKVMNTINTELSKTNFEIINFNSKNLPSDFLADTNLAVFLNVTSQLNNWPFRTVTSHLYNYEGEVLHSRSVRHDRSPHFLTRLVLEEIVAYPYIYSPKSNMDSKKITREEAIKKLKEAKELLDLGILKKEEYDKIADELKPVIINN